MFKDRNGWLSDGKTLKCVEKCMHGNKEDCKGFKRVKSCIQTKLYPYTIVL